MLCCAVRARERSKSLGVVVAQCSAARESQECSAWGRFGTKDGGREIRRFDGDMLAAAVPSRELDHLGAAHALAVVLANMHMGGGFDNRHARLGWATSYNNKHTPQSAETSPKREPKKQEAMRKGQASALGRAPGCKRYRQWLIRRGTDTSTGHHLVPRPQKDKQASRRAKKGNLSEAKKKRKKKKRERDGSRDTRRLGAGFMRDAVDKAIAGTGRPESTTKQARWSGNTGIRKARMTSGCFNSRLGWEAGLDRDAPPACR